MDRRHLLGAALLGAGAAATGKSPASAGAPRSKALDPHGYARALRPVDAVAPAGRTVDLSDVPEWRLRPIDLPERYANARFSATDHRGTLFGTFLLPMAEQQLDHRDGIVVWRQGRCTEISIPGYITPYLRDANRHGQAVYTANAARPGASIRHGADVSFLLRPGRPPQLIPPLSANGEVSVQSINDAGIISGTADGQWVTWSIDRLDRPTIHPAPARGGAANCFIDNDGTLVGTQVNSFDTGMVYDAYRMQQDMSRWLPAGEGEVVQAYGVANGLAICRYESPADFRALTWDRAGQVTYIDGMETPMKVNRDGLVAGYPAAGSGILLWQGGRHVGRVAGSDSRVVSVFGLSDRGELIGQCGEPNGKYRPAMWTAH